MYLVDEAGATDTELLLELLLLFKVLLLTTMLEPF